MKTLIVAGSAADAVNEAAYGQIKGWAVGDLREWILADTTTNEMIRHAAGGMTAEMIAAEKNRCHQARGAVKAGIEAHITYLESQRSALDEVLDKIIASNAQWAVNFYGVDSNGEFVYFNPNMGTATAVDDQKFELAPNAGQTAIDFNADDAAQSYQGTVYAADLTNMQTVKDIAAGNTDVATLAAVGFTAAESLLYPFLAILTAVTYYGLIAFSGEGGSGAEVDQLEADVGTFDDRASHRLEG